MVDGFKAEFESAGFVRADLVPVSVSQAVIEVNPSSGDRQEVEHLIASDQAPAIWRLVPRVELPPMYGPAIVRTTSAPGIAAGNPGPGEIRNPGFKDGQLTYTRSAIESVGPFDVASTWEYVLPGRPNDRCLVVSQRFYQFCKMHKIEATFIPLRIIDDEQAGK